MILARNTEGESEGEKIIIEPESGARFEGGLCLVRFSAAGGTERAILCVGDRLEWGGLRIASPGEPASVEIDFASGANAIAAGTAPEGLEIELDGAKIWPR